VGCGAAVAARQLRAIGSGASRFMDAVAEDSDCLCFANASAKWAGRLIFRGGRKLNCSQASKSIKVLSRCSPTMGYGARQRIARYACRTRQALVVACSSPLASNGCFRLARFVLSFERVRHNTTISEKKRNTWSVWEASTSNKLPVTCHVKVVPV
jgi:hypothetical protein